MFKSSDETPDNAKAKGSSKSFSDIEGFWIIVGFSGSSKMSGKDKVELNRNESDFKEN